MTGALLLVCGLCLPAAVQAQDFTLIVTQPAMGCQWNGTVDLGEPSSSAGCDTTFSGTMMLTRVAGDPSDCPATISGPVSGMLTGSTVTFGLVSTEFGTINFSGTVSSGGVTASGSWSGSPGTGAWYSEGEVELGGGMVNVTVIDPMNGCVWNGPITGSGGILFDGSLNLRLTTGGPACSASISGPISGTLFGTAVCFEVMSTDFGNATFTGTVNLAARSAMGTWSGDAGKGTWSTQAIQASPTLGPFAVGALLLTLLFIARRRGRTSVTHEE